MSYKVYRNLNNGKLSIKERKSGLVVGHCDEVDMFLAEFKVSHMGVCRIRREKRKAVVATVNGGITWMKGFTPYKGRDVQTCCGHLVGEAPIDVAFNPYKYTSFVERSNERPIDKAEIVHIDNTGTMKARAVTYK